MHSGFLTNTSIVWSKEQKLEKCVCKGNTQMHTHFWQQKLDMAYDLGKVQDIRFAPNLSEKPEFPRALSAPSHLKPIS